MRKQFHKIFVVALTVLALSITLSITKANVNFANADTLTLDSVIENAIINASTSDCLNKTDEQEYSQCINDFANNFVNEVDSSNFSATFDYKNVISQNYQFDVEQTLNQKEDQLTEAAKTADSATKAKINQAKSDIRTLKKLAENIESGDYKSITDDELKLASVYYSPKTASLLMLKRISSIDLGEPDEYIQALIAANVYDENANVTIKGFSYLNAGGYAAYAKVKWLSPTTGEVHECNQGTNLTFPNRQTVDLKDFCSGIEENSTVSLGAVTGTGAKGAWLSGVSHETSFASDLTKTNPNQEVFTYKASSPFTVGYATAGTTTINNSVSLQAVGSDSAVSGALDKTKSQAVAGAAIIGLGVGMLAVSIVLAGVETIRSFKSSIADEGGLSGFMRDPERAGQVSSEIASEVVQNENEIARAARGAEMIESEHYTTARRVGKSVDYDWVETELDRFAPGSADYFLRQSQEDADLFRSLRKALEDRRDLDRELLYGIARDRRFNFTSNAGVDLREEFIKFLDEFYCSGDQPSRMAIERFGREKGLTDITLYKALAALTDSQGNYSGMLQDYAVIRKFFADYPDVAEFTRRQQAVYDGANRYFVSILASNHTYFTGFNTIAARLLMAAQTDENISSEIKLIFGKLKSFCLPTSVRELDVFEGFIEGLKDQKLGSDISGHFEYASGITWGKVAAMSFALPTAFLFPIGSDIANNASHDAINPWAEPQKSALPSMEPYMKNAGTVLASTGNRLAPIEHLSYSSTSFVKVQPVVHYLRGTDKNEKTCEFEGAESLSSVSGNETSLQAGIPDVFATNCKTVLQDGDEVWITGKTKGAERNEKADGSQTRHFTYALNSGAFAGYVTLGTLNNNKAEYLVSYTSDLQRFQSIFGMFVAGNRDAFWRDLASLTSADQGNGDVYNESLENNLQHLYATDVTSEIVASDVQALLTSTSYTDFVKFEKNDLNNHQVTTTTVKSLLAVIYSAQKLTTGQDAAANQALVAKAYSALKQVTDSKVTLHSFVFDSNTNNDYALQDVNFGCENDKNFVNGSIFPDKDSDWTVVKCKATRKYTGVAETLYLSAPDSASVRIGGNNAADCSTQEVDQTTPVIFAASAGEQNFTICVSKDASSESFAIGVNTRDNKNWTEFKYALALNITFALPQSFKEEVTVAANNDESVIEDLPNLLDSFAESVAGQKDANDEFIYKNVNDIRDAFIAKHTLTDEQISYLVSVGFTQALSLHRVQLLGSIGSYAAKSQLLDTDTATLMEAGVNFSKAFGLSEYEDEEGNSDADLI